MKYGESNIDIISPTIGKSYLTNGALYTGDPSKINPSSKGCGLLYQNTFVGSCG
jgi:hypothetical protein